MHIPKYKIKFKKRNFEVGFHFKENDQFDLEIITKGRFCGDDYVALRKYLEEEGYVEEAKNQFLKYAI
jgi:hypothetical protein